MIFISSNCVAYNSKWGGVKEQTNRKRKTRDFILLSKLIIIEVNKWGLPLHGLVL